MAIVTVLYGQFGSYWAINISCTQSQISSNVSMLPLGNTWVIKTEALDEATITTVAGICNYDVIERAVLGTTARHADYDHANS